MSDYACCMARCRGTATRFYQAVSRRYLLTGQANHFQNGVWEMPASAWHPRCEVHRLDEAFMRTWGIREVAEAEFAVVEVHGS